MMVVESLEVCFSQETSRQTTPCVQEHCLEKAALLLPEFLSFLFALVLIDT